VIIDDYVTPAELTGYVREVPLPTGQILNRFLPDQRVNDIEAAWDEATRTNRAAKFRAYNAPTPVGRRDSFTRSRVTLPPLGQKTVIGEWERLQLERIRTGGTADNGVIDAIYNDVEINASAVHNRMELARGDVLVDGKFTLAGENGLTIEADFGVPAGHLVTAAVVWSNYATGTPLSDERAWRQTYIDANGQPPGYVLMPSATIGHLLLSEQYRELAPMVVGGSPSILTEESLNAIRRAHRLPEIIEYDHRVEVDGVNVRTIPADRVIYLPQNPRDLGYTAWGITAEALELAGLDNPGLVYEEMPGLVGVVMKEGDPLRTWTKVGAVGMPILERPRLLMVGDVL